MIKPKDEMCFMKKEELFNNLREEVRKKLAECKTKEEIRRVLAEAGVDSLDDALLDGVSGGMRTGFYEFSI